MKVSKIILKCTRNVLLVLLALFVLIGVYSNIKLMKNPGEIPSIFGFRNFTVLTGSMTPAIAPGDMIISKEVMPLSINVGDVITYKENDTIITHRVIEKKEENENYVFITKGDANNIKDENYIKENQIIGKIVFKIPLLGHARIFLASKIGMVLLISILVLLFGLSEFKSKLTKEERGVNE
jgi:signal peptidase